MLLDKLLNWELPEKLEEDEEEVELQKVSRNSGWAAQKRRMQLRAIKEHERYQVEKKNAS